MNTVENQTGAKLRPIAYWRLWVLDTMLVTGAFLFFLATRYGTYEFFGRALLMALLPLIPVMVLVGGAGSTVFALTKVLIEKRKLKKPVALTLLVGPAVLVALPLVLLGAWKAPGYRLGYVCLGNAPASVSHVQVTGYSTFLREEWLAVFNVSHEDFQMFVNNSKLEPVPSLEFSGMLERSSLKTSKTFENLAPADNLICFRRIFKESTEHQRGRVYAAFDPAASSAVVFREYHD